ncbi:MAG: hypothetical protein V1824_02955 [archaeon]
MLYETSFLISLLINLIIEIPLVYLIIKFIYKEKLDFKKIIIVTLLASITTLPYLWFVFPSYINSTYYLIIGEIIVFIIEAIIYKLLLDLKLIKAIILSLVANLFSFLLGLLIKIY